MAAEPLRWEVSVFNKYLFSVQDDPRYPWRRGEEKQKELVNSAAVNKVFQPDAMDAKVVGGVCEGRAMHNCQGTSPHDSDYAFGHSSDYHAFYRTANNWLSSLIVFCHALKLLLLQIRKKHKSNKVLDTSNGERGSKKEVTQREDIYNKHGTESINKSLETEDGEDSPAH